jgi:hypothetical protein
MELLVKLFGQLCPEPQPVRPYRHPSEYKVLQGQRQYADGMTKLYQPNWFTVAVATVTLGLYIGIGHIILALLIGGFWNHWLWAVLTVLFSTVALPAPPRRLVCVTHSWLFLCWRRYFHFSYLFEENLDAYKDYVIAQFPHGAFPIGPLLCGTFMHTEYPEYNVQALAAHSAFMVPIWRHIHAWIGTAACTRNNFHRLLANGVNGPIARRAAVHDKTLTDVSDSESESARAEVMVRAPRAHNRKRTSKHGHHSQQKKKQQPLPRTLIQRLLRYTPWQQALETQKTRNEWNCGCSGRSKQRTGG